MKKLIQLWALSHEERHFVVKSQKCLTWLEELGALEAGSKKVTTEWVVSGAIVFTAQQYIYIYIETYLQQIRNHLYQKEPSQCSEQERIRTEISDLTEELHQKEITIATIMEKASLLERRLKTELQIKDKLLAKQQVCKQAKTS